MSHARMVVWLMFVLVVPTSAQESGPASPQPKSAEKVYEVPAEGLVIDGKLSKDDPPLAIVQGKPPHQMFRVRLKKGQSYVLYLSSSEFDAMLVLQDAVGRTLAFDNDSGGGQNSRIALPIPSDGEYRLSATALNRRQGNFQLKIRAGGLTAEEKQADRATALNREGVQLYQRGQGTAAVAKIREALEIREKLYPAEQYPGGHPDLATSLSNLGAVLGALGQYEQALPYYRRGLEMREELFPAAKYPGGHPEVAASLNNMGFVLQAMGQPEQALTYYRRSLDMKRKLYPAEQYPESHPDLALSLNNLGSLLMALGQSEQAVSYLREGLEANQKLYPAAKFPDGNPNVALSLINLGTVLRTMGQAEEALPYFRRGLEMCQKLFPASRFPDGHPKLAAAFNSMGLALQLMGQSEQALAYHSKSLQMYRKLYPSDRYPDGHPQLADSLHNLGAVAWALGQSDQALAYYRQSLEMTQKLFPAAKYPDGHPDLAASLNNLGGVLQALGQSDQALTYYRRCLQMYQKLYPASKYPAGHPDLALGLNNMGGVLQSMGRTEEALPYFRRGLEMCQRLYPSDRYPAGHPRLATSLNNMGGELWAMGQSEQALTYFRRGLRMYQNLFPSEKYPDGHPQLALGFNNLGNVLMATGQTEEALPFAGRSLEMQQRLLRRELVTATEGAAFDMVAAVPAYRDSLLSITRTGRTPVDEVVTQIWPSRAIVTRLLEQRQANARAAGTELGDMIDRLRGLRRRFDQLLQDSQLKPEERDRLLAVVARERDTLERELVAEMPTLQRYQELDQLGPADLAKALPPDTVYLDVIRYTHFEYVNKKQKQTERYVAFVLSKDRPVQRIELGEAAHIDREVQAWRRLIEEYGNDRPEAQQLKQLVWDKLAPHLPKGTKTLYLTADGDLARMPWAALPIGDNCVLLEDYALAHVPHGTFLLEQLKYPRTYTGDDTALALGGIRYDSPKWPELPGTATELKALDERQPIILSGTDATQARLLAELPKARVAHLATHGFFNAEELTAERQRAAKALESQLLGDDLRKVAAKNPLGYVGLVLAEGEVLSGLSIPDVPLTNTHLVTLSACETGLGELTGGEGVQGLQRAFHLAGCPNVVASLWKVNDDATAALMTRFYHELLVNRKPPVEALREAQLLIYRRPDLKQDLLAERGSTRKKLAVDADPQAAAGTKHAATKLWAAFVLSGVGR